MFGLETELLILLIFCLLAACAFEFVNGFHDTANAVATVIYTNSLQPWTAVIWSGICNFAGVMLGGISVAMGIVNLLPVEMLIDQNVWHSVAMVLALLFSAIIWNLGTWYYGLPSSSSHTLIGSILGVGLAFSMMPEHTSGEAVNWSKASEIGLSLLVSPLFGFSMSLLLMFLLKRLVKDPQLFREPPQKKAPPAWIRGVLIATCTLVSFFHGSNDGQKGVGLIMLILISIVPIAFALDNRLETEALQTNMSRIEQTITHINVAGLPPSSRGTLNLVAAQADSVQAILAASSGTIPRDQRLTVRRDILLIASEVKAVTANPPQTISPADVSALRDAANGIRSYTDYAPRWVIVIVSLSLGLGTMVGWKRIVKTVGEKIGKQHLTYAQGASAELVAASTIGLASGLGLPVSTTHVLSSGVAGSMVASGGVSNIQPRTVRSIALAWVLTLPVSVTLAALLYFFFRWIF
jgi:PiT family inorganic phosphate transporter